jgi:hypothetical protein
MEEKPELASTTHLVGHLLRELDGTLREVLRPMSDEDEWPEWGTTGAHRKIVKLCCDALGVPDDDPLRGAWYAFAKGLHGRAHRPGVAAPRPVDAKFRAFWSEGEDVIYEVARLIEGNYISALGIIEELAAGPPDITKLKQSVPNSVVALDRFFELVGIEWFEPLRKEGFFENPPPLVPKEDGTVAFARWPQAQLIRRMAPECPEAVVRLAAGLDTENPDAQQAFVDAALSIDPAVGVGMVDDVERWLETQPTWALPFKVRDLVVHLVRGGQPQAGTRLMAALLRAAQRERDGYLVGELASDLISEVFPVVGVVGLEPLIDQLADTVEEDSYDGEDHSSIWRPRIDPGPAPRCS